MAKENEKRVPKLRFKGFTDDWEQRKLGDTLVELKSGLSRMLSNKDIGVPVIRANNIKNGMLDLKADIKYWYSDDPQGANIENYLVEKENILINFINSESKMGTAAIVREAISRNTIYTTNILKAQTNNDFNSYFWFTLTQTLQYKNSIKMITKPAVNQSSFTTVDFKKLIFAFPILSEQTKIGNFIKLIDNTITLHQRKLAQLEKLKQALLQQMFPKKDETVPKLRFANFNEDWKQRKLGELGESKSGIGFPDEEQGGKKGIPFFKVSDMNNIGNEHEMKNSNNYVDTEQLKKRNWKPIMNVPAVIFAKVGAAIMLNRKRIVRMPFLLDNNTMAYIFDDSWNSDFGKILFETIYLPRYAQVGALPSYNSSDINSVKVFIPNKNEQEKIGVFFKELDNLITVHHHKLDQLKLLKKELLQQMFI
ncbi:restriction endonuclease subunit S [Aerococcus viridans]|uniref:Restriction endonuclease subunit S n=1 Tax=Aerococcus viridans TaxID=1377 RepID=A0A2N6UED4_9LACT|nr:restriction endonuclease subunit S [Aerococcus viridans]PMC79912.1 restriction endonuclease subunit S [Aerococcus viridans]